MFANRCFLAVFCLLMGTAWASAEQVRGVISKVDAEQKELVIEGRGIGVRGAVIRFSLGKDTQILFGRQAGAIGDLSVGKQVNVSFETQDGKRVAVTINVSGSKPAAPARPVADDANTVSGLLRRIARTDREIILATPGEQGKEGYVSLPVPEDAKITRDDKAIQFDDLKEEEPAVVRTETRNGKKVAVAVMTGKTSAPAAMAQQPGDQASRIARLRQLLQLADMILERAEKREK